MASFFFFWRKTNPDICNYADCIQRKPKKKLRGKSALLAQTLKNKTPVFSFKPRQTNSTPQPTSPNLLNLNNSLEKIKSLQRNTQIFFFFPNLTYLQKKKQFILPATLSRPLVSGAGGVGQVEHDGGVGGLEADGAGRRVDECRVAVCHNPVALGRGIRASATGNTELSRH